MTMPQTTTLTHEHLINQLKRLRLQEVSRQYAEIARLAEKDRRTYEQYLGQLVEIELEYKNQLRLKKLISDARFPLDKTLDTFKWGSRSGITQKQVVRLCQGDWVRQGGNVVFYGDIGVGKTHLAICIGKALCEQGLKVAFYSTHQLVEQLLEAKKSLELAALFRRLDRFDLILCDELGYLPQTQDGADLFFQLISQRSERKSLLITTNLTYSEWDQVFLNPRSTKAAVDRIIHHCETFNVLGPSHRAEVAKAREEMKRKTQAALTEDAPIVT